MRFRLSLVAACAVCYTVSASAHHSHGQYEETFTDIEGVVTELHLLTAHSWIYLEVKDVSGASHVWALVLGFLKARDGSVRDWDGGNAPAPKDF